MAHKKTAYFLPALIIAIIAVMALILQKNGREKDGIDRSEAGVNRPNIILLSIDTLRADRLRCYGYARDTSPSIDALAKESYLFTDVLSQYPTTPQSHASLLTSRYYSSLSAEMLRGRSFPVMAEMLKQAGYTTAAFVDGGYMKRQFGYGFDRGFDFYHDAGPPVQHGKQIEWNGVAHINEQVFRWLENNKKEPFFLLFHCYDVHCPYTPPEPYFSRYTGWYEGDLEVRGKCGTYFNQISLTNDDYRFLSDLYDGGIQYADFELGRLFQKLKALKLYKPALIIFCSDHGESLGEGGHVGHNRLKPHQLQVPLIMKIPGRSGGVVEAPVQLLDILPTVMAYLALPEPEDLEGSNLLPLLPGGAGTDLKDRIRISERDQFRWIEKSGQWALWCDLSQKDIRLYDLRRDPELKENVAGKHLDVVQDLFEKFRETESFRDGQFVLGAEETGESIQMDSETRDQLKRLGYLE